MNRWWYCVAVILLLAARVEAAEPTNDRPNVVFILADDFGYGDLHCYGHPYAKTPNIDRLAAEGTRYLQVYSTGVTCCPARTGLMTGRFPARYQKYPASYGFGDRMTVTALLHNRGYVTGHFGKWHIGPETTKGTYGIDEIESDVDAPRATKRSTEQGRDDHIFDDAIRFVEAHKDQPFFMNVWGHITHHPVNPAQKFVDEFASLKVNESDFSEYQREKFELVRKGGGDVNDSMRHFVADVYALDLAVGRLLAKLDELGLREKTIVVFSSDQGAAAPPDPTAGGPAKKRNNGKPANAETEQLRLNLMGSAGELRGGKHRDYEGGVRVPFIVRWPGHTPAGRVDRDSVLSFADWLPTLCSIAGAAGVPKDLDGEDVSKALSGGTHVRTKPLFWKTNTANSDPAIRWQNWKFHGSNRKRGEVELFDLATDPGERRNLAAERADIVRELSTRLDSWTSSLPTTYDHGTSRDD